MWSDEAAARADLRMFLHDGPTDKPVKQKKVIGAIDGTNKIFLTWDDRLIPGTLSAWIDDQPVDPGQLTLDEVIGQITFLTAPSANSILRAGYYYQYFLDDEVDRSLELATGEVLEISDVTKVADGLRLSVLNFGGHVLYEKLASRWVDRMTSRFLMEEAPSQNDTLNRTNSFAARADKYLARAQQLRNDYYQNHGRRAKPAFGILTNRPPSIGPRR